LLAIPLRDGPGLRGDVINGAATALTDRKGPRMGNSLTYWLEVEKQEP